MEPTIALGCNLGLFAGSDLTTDHGVIANGDSAGESSLRRNHDVVAYIAVVSNMYQVVEFSSSTDPGYTQSSAIDAAVCPDLDIILDLEQYRPGEISRSGPT